MSILIKHLQFVNEQAAFHEKMADKYGLTTFRANLHKGTSDKFRALSADLESADKLLDAEPVQTAPKPRGPIQLSLSMEDLEGLPAELIGELSVSDADRTEFAIVNSIEEAGGIISLDKLLIALYKKTGEVHKRDSMYSRLARLVQKNAIYYVPGKKGVYSSEQLSQEDVMKLFGPKKEADNSDS